jgi:hypothetical protein
MTTAGLSFDDADVNNALVFLLLLREDDDNDDIFPLVFSEEEEEEEEEEVFCDEAILIVAMRLWCGILANK